MFISQVSIWNIDVYRWNVIIMSLLGVEQLTFGFPNRHCISTPPRQTGQFSLLESLSLHLNPLVPLAFHWGSLILYKMGRTNQCRTYLGLINRGMSQKKNNDFQHVTSELRIYFQSNFQFLEKNFIISLICFKSRNLEVGKKNALLWESKTYIPCV